MSWDKWILRGNGGEAFVVKRNDLDGMVIIGGHNQFKTAMEHAFLTGLGMEPPENTHPQRGRVKMIAAGVGKIQWNHALRVWGEDWRAERSNVHGRLL